ncbi:Glutamine--fructose-6-phosphate aminotransferase, isomerizing [Candidatus Arsenophonus lipoptenae]|uniref:Glutamine--fructose-6-phosphate aminotransferase [isomerizing] n=1 Tax=Candidatus Arsenophonus lipoptenae TaxID=634113 RepID=A0A120HPV8_9GAMM|nr:glutamine--fructose-6-phosphate transaminase (isomerizing) [Candidatus Arsenophonus lipoptenae]AMA64933.1 Glutamine--fructose-6-phosphate aminotransferase, isomerizing [Candidatus Arsenophonus lipoptenae]
MCGIIGAVSQRDIAGILIDGLRRLEYRGYDSSGLAMLDDKANLICLRKLGKVQFLVNEFKKHTIIGSTGIAHTRWATHGQPSKKNAHPHISEYIAVVHNGIIENHQKLRTQLKKLKYVFTSETDTEVIAHLTHWELQKGGTLLEGIQRVIPQLHGTYGAVIMDSRTPGILVGARSGSPLIIGLGKDENFLASDQLALISITRCFMYLEEGDIVEVTNRKVRIFNQNGIEIKRKLIKSNIQYQDNIYDKGIYCHYIQKEIHEQPDAIKNALADRLDNHNRVILNELNKKAQNLLSKIEHIQIVACGTSYNAGMVARYWFESLSGIPCDVEIASEFRYRKLAQRKNSLFITISQSGETADTLAALRLSKKLNYLLSLAICNVIGSSLVRESDFSLMIRAGIEISVASTKAFTAQLTVLLLLVAYLLRLKNKNIALEHDIVKALHVLPFRISSVLSYKDIIEVLAKDFFDKNYVIFLGRGDQFPIAIEGALKLKEISYIHAEAYAAGELKHGPLALIDNHVPVIITAPNNKLLEKLKVNIAEISSRGGILYVFADKDAGFVNSKNIKVISLPYVEELIAPIFYIIPLQLLSYYVALIKGTDVDQPRNLAKSVTVE